MPPLEDPPTKVYATPTGGTRITVGNTVGREDDWHTVAKMYGVNVQALILYNFGTLNTREVNWYLRTRVGCKVPSKWNWKFTMAKPGHIHIPPVPPVQFAHQVYTYSVAALSWIDPRTGLLEVDQGDPGDVIGREEILANKGYRFANFLEATTSAVSTGNGPMPVVFGHTGYTKDCGIYRSLSFAGIPSYPYPIKLFDPVMIDGGVEFRQIVGARTQSAEVLAGMIAPGPIGPVGGMIAQKLVPLPPIWSDLKLTIRYDGTYTGELIAHSLFPSLTYYENSKIPCLMMGGSGSCQAYDKKSGYDGMPNYKRWMKEGKGWGTQKGYTPGEGNPWGVTAPDPEANFGEPQEDPNEVVRRPTTYPPQPWLPPRS